MRTVLHSLYICVFGSPGLPRMAGMSFGSLTTTKFLKGTRNLHAQVSFLVAIYVSISVQPAACAFPQLGLMSAF